MSTLQVPARASTRTFPDGFKWGLAEAFADYAG
jgi:hypothetical protein